MGYVYLASTESYAKNNKYKIGRSVNPEKRMKELGAGHVEDFEMIKSWKCNDENVAESIVHKALSGKRVSTNREFFYGPKEELIKKIDNILSPIPFAKVISKPETYSGSMRPSSSFVAPNSTYPTNPKVGCPVYDDGDYAAWGLGVLLLLCVALVLFFYLPRVENIPTQNVVQSKENAEAEWEEIRKTVKEINEMNRKEEPIKTQHKNVNKNKRNKRNNISPFSLDNPYR